jgi:hypothetical protein
MPPRLQLAASVSSSLTDVVSLACVLAVLAVYAVPVSPYPQFSSSLLYSTTHRLDWAT